MNTRTAINKKLHNFVIDLLNDALGSVDPSNRVNTPAAKEVARRHAAQALNLAIAVLTEQVDVSNPSDSSELRRLYLAAIRQRDIIHNVHEIADTLRGTPQGSNSEESVALRKNLNQQLETATAELEHLRSQAIRWFGISI
jgi:hypothetical protein